MKIRSPVLLEISEITLDKEIQPRSQLNETVIEKYSEAMLIGAQFPPITVFYDGFKHWLADGFHRVQAKRAVGERKILAEIMFGARRDAILYAVGANTIHGLALSKSDKRKIFGNVLYKDKRNALLPSNKAQNRKRNSKSNQHDKKLSPSS